jgi:hypothetical protein
MVVEDGPGSEVPTDDAAIVAMIRELREKLDELERTKPAHGLKPAHIMEIEDIEDRIARLEDRLARMERP